MEINKTHFEYVPTSTNNAWRRADWCADLIEEVAQLQDSLQHLGAAEDRGDAEATARAIRTCNMRMHEVRQVLDYIGGQTY